LLIFYYFHLLYLKGQWQDGRTLAVFIKPFPQALISFQYFRTLLKFLCGRPHANSAPAFDKVCTSRNQDFDANSS
jgi:hypothetical protein